MPFVFKMSVASDLPDDDKDAILRSLNDLAEVSPADQRQLLPGWDLFVAVVQDIGALASAAAALSKLAAEILKWRAIVRKRGHSARLRLERPSKPALDVATASDEEVVNWFQNSNGK